MMVESADPVNSRGPEEPGADELEDGSHERHVTALLCEVRDVM